MPHQPDFYTAMTGNPNGVDPVEFRDAWRKRASYTLQVNESAQDLISTDPQTGEVILTLVQHGRVYALDPDDHTATHDGTTVLVTYDGLVYKLDQLTVPYAVISKDLLAPPASPQLGDAYLLLGAGTGAWAGKGPIVTLTGWGWESVAAQPGRMIYVENNDAYYHVDKYGNVLAGLGAGPISDASLTPRHFLGDGDLFQFIVKNQTTNTPPTNPNAGDAYVAASAPTSPWTTPGRVYRFEYGAWKEYAPRIGWKIYDIALGAEYRFNGTVWAAAAASFANQQTFSTPGSTTWSKPSSGAWVLIEIWAGGGSGGARGSGQNGNASGGGGGGYNKILMRLAQLPSTLSLVIGAGGAAVSGNTNGNDGGATTVTASGQLILTAAGGVKGSQIGNGQGITGGAGGSPSAAPGGFNVGPGGGGGDGTNGGTASDANGDPSVYGGGGGAGLSSIGSQAGTGGLSVFAGKGGNATINGPGEAGVAPAGGGAGGHNGNISGKGGDGRIVITVF